MCMYTGRKGQPLVTMFSITEHYTTVDNRVFRSLEPLIAAFTVSFIIGLVCVIIKALA